MECIEITLAYSNSYGLSDRCPDRVIWLNTWSSFGDAVWGGSRMFRWSITGGRLVLGGGHQESLTTY